MSIILPIKLPRKNYQIYAIFKINCHINNKHYLLTMSVCVSLSLFLSLFLTLSVFVSVGPSETQSQRHVHNNVRGISLCSIVRLLIFFLAQLKNLSGRCNRKLLSAQPGLFRIFRKLKILNYLQMYSICLVRSAIMLILVCCLFGLLPHHSQKPVPVS